ncbi:type II secretion system protein [Candidatus Daviesbacteria bacterium]|nr:type II secretion system protein [Candidatus Daviesbacteria bacterium]
MIRKVQSSKFKVRSSKGFTLVEMLVVIAVLGVIGSLILAIFTSTLRGSNKSQIISIIKQNGQSVLETMDKTIRNSEGVVCVSSANDVIAVVQDNIYTRYKFVTSSSSAKSDCVTENGCILQDNPVRPSSGSEADIDLFLDSLCVNPLDSPKILTDTNKKTGVSVRKTKDASGSELPYISRSERSGFKDVVTIRFSLEEGKEAPPEVAGQIDPIPFQTSIELR